MTGLNFFDLHSDILTSACSEVEIKKQIENNQKQGYKSINAIYNGDLSIEEALKIAKKAKEINCDIAFENCCYNNYEGESLGEKVSEDRLNKLANCLMQFNPLYLSLTWNYENEFASGCSCEGGLKLAGKKFIQILNLKNAVIDTAHLNEKSFFETAEYANKLICSHTAFSSVFAHKRNLTDTQIKVVLQKKGIVGLVAVGHFLTGAKKSISAYENAFYEHIDGFLQKFGAKNLCVATDFYGSDAPVFLNGDYSFVQRLQQSLEKRGVSSNDISAILYKNAFSYFYGLQI